MRQFIGCVKEFRRYLERSPLVEKSVYIEEYSIFGFAGHSFGAHYNLMNVGKSNRDCTNLGR